MTEPKKSFFTDNIKFFARGRWLRLDKPQRFDASDPNSKPRWDATFILDPTSVQGAADIKNLLEQAAALAREGYGKVPLAIKKLAAKFIPGTPKLDLNDPKNAEDGIRLFCMSDGDDAKHENAPAYKGKFIVTASRGAVDKQGNPRSGPAVVNRNNVVVRPGDPQYPYDGANLRASVAFWLLMGPTAQKTGKLVGCNLVGVQFVSDNQAFTQDAIDADFDALEDETTAGTATETSAFD